MAGVKNNQLKMENLFKEAGGYDLLCFQETHFKDESDTKNFDNTFEAQFRVFHSVTNENFKGVSLIINRRQLGSGFQKVFEIPGKAIAIKYKMNNLAVLIVGIYAPAQAKFRPGFFGDMGKGLGRLPLDCDLVTCLGDFNCVEDKALDRTCIYAESDFRRYWNKRFLGYKTITAFKRCL